GAIADDVQDHRPGSKAAAEHGVLAPLADVGLSKADVRRYSREHGLPTADKPSFACLSSRVPYGTAIDKKMLNQLERAEQVLRDLGYKQFRVRHHGPVARIELLPEELARAVLEDRDRILQGVREAGYAYVSLDLAGYRTGAMNEVLR
ncbi:MAG: ATP-dependent sacrificial sulfur transferase LarE, partial [Planctomycetota bacterium]